MDVDRILNMRELLKKKSFFLFGPRSTGKSTLAEAQLAGEALFIDLLDGTTYLRLVADPSALEQMIGLPGNEHKIVIIDEIQKIPALLDQIHRLIEKKHRRFLMTGSSARKLRAGAANLLAGRAWAAQLFPLVYTEIPKPDLMRILRYGTLPQVYFSDDPEEELAAYSQTYLREEIQTEGLVRKIPQFSRFLKVAALCNGQTINYSSVGSDCGVAASTVREYFSILEDTLIGFTVEPWMASRRRKAIQTAKFYLFDTGVTHMLAGTETLDRNSDLFGKSFEQWIGMELRAYVSYRRLKVSLLFWRSTSGHEVDFLIGNALAIEVKSTTKVVAQDLRGLRALAEESVFSTLIYVSHDKIDRNVDGILCYHWQTFVTKLWGDELFPARVGGG